MSTGPPPVGPGPLRLRPPVAGDKAFRAYLRQRDVAGEWNWFDDPPEERLLPGTVAVTRLIVTLEDGTPVGEVSWFGVPYGPNRRSLAWRIGIIVAPPHRGLGHGTAAQRMLAEHLFATTAANRVEADIDVENVAEQRALAGAGFSRESVIRGAQYRLGSWHDLVMYSRLR